MSKNKKGKVVSLRPAQLSPEKYIKTQARLLPVFECLITEDWADNGISNIVVARMHKSGHITAGIYLVDNYCLGLKETTYEFNMEPEEYEYLKENCGVVENCSYVLAHNMIYGAIAYAEECGFKPHKDFDVSQFILENDDDDVELMDIEFGYEGMPFYVKGPNDDDAKVNFIKNTLSVRLARAILIYWKMWRTMMIGLMTTTMMILMTTTILMQRSWSNYCVC